ncbi:hydantoinase B/oxoprolinase family protein [Peribacillus butanolivorans]|uniref:hydantoinase B/oxoprolinase family protein n=1 Tax=Peribacillus butanolivorans TaxID=421767 RepID=UPI00364AF761
MSTSTKFPNLVDPLVREIFRYTTQSITEELEINITRTAYSPMIYELQDYCIALITPDFQTFMQSENAIPIFITDMGEPVRNAVATIGVDRLSPGDVFVTNFGTGQHVNNVTMATPLYHGEELTGYLVIRAHWEDVGGLIPGGQAMGARSIFHEGTRYHGIRVMRRGKVVPEVLATFQANTYQKEAVTGDLMAQIAALTLGARRWQEQVVSRWSADQVRALITTQFEASVAYARQAISDIPDGIYEAQHAWTYKQGGFTEDMVLKVKVKIDGERMIVDLSEMPPQTSLPINAGRIGGGMAAVYLAFRYLVPSEFPTDQGFFEPVEVVLPEGTIVSATGDAPMGFWNATISLVIDLVIRAIGETHPDRVPASHFASLGAIHMQGKEPDGSPWRYSEAALGGLGADKDADGYGPVKALIIGNMKSASLEMAEARFPVRYNSYSLRRESGGAGLHRGGPGTERVIEVLTDVFFDSHGELSVPAPGLAGGEPGELGSIEIKLPNSDQWIVPEGSSTGVSSLPAGTNIRQRSGGGGGWGRPTDRRGVSENNKDSEPHKTKG